MTPEMAKRWLPIIQAVAEGKVIQYFDHKASIWIDASDNWNSLGWCPDSLRIKAEAREFWIVRHVNGGWIGVAESAESVKRLTDQYTDSCKIIHVREVIDE